MSSRSPYLLRSLQVTVSIPEDPTAPPAASQETAPPAPSAIHPQAPPPPTMTTVGELQAQVTELQGTIKTLQQEGKEQQNVIAALKEAAQKSPAPPPNLAALLPDKFEGGEDEDIEDWLGSFRDYATFQGWAANRKRKTASEYFEYSITARSGPLVLL